VRAFAFRLERVLEWREAQRRIGEGRVAAAAGRLTGIRDEIASRTRELRESASQVIETPTGAILGSYGDYTKRAGGRFRNFRSRGCKPRRPSLPR
jgi:hypothetical protein